MPRHDDDYAPPRRKKSKSRKPRGGSKTTFLIGGGLFAAAVIAVVVVIIVKKGKSGGGGESKPAANTDSPGLAEKLGPKTEAPKIGGPPVIPGYDPTPPKQPPKEEPVTLATLLKDPKWKSGPDVLAALDGEWWEVSLRQRNFGRDGAFGYKGGTVDQLNIVHAVPGGFKLKGERQVEMAHHLSYDAGAASKKPHSFTVLVADEELYMFMDLGNGQTRMEGPYYRMREDRRGLAQARIIEPLLTKLQSSDPAARFDAAWKLSHLGKKVEPHLDRLLTEIRRGGVGLPEMISTLETFTLESRKKALPDLIKVLRNPQYPPRYDRVLSSTMFIIRGMGPAASDALPTLRDLQKLPMGQLHHAYGGQLGLTIEDVSRK